jgi:hypothetical protein
MSVKSLGDTRTRIEYYSLRVVVLNLREQKIRKTWSSPTHWNYGLAEILNASGMAEIIESHHREWEDVESSAPSCLREDGGTDIGRLLGYVVG